MWFPLHERDEGVAGGRQKQSAMGGWSNDRERVAGGVGDMVKVLHVWSPAIGRWMERVMLWCRSTEYAGGDALVSPAKAKWRDEGGWWSAHVNRKEDSGWNKI
jgi:hypothetical protein